MQPISWKSLEGTPVPMGVVWIESEQAYNFALYSKHAHKVTLLLYTADCLATPATTYAFDHLKNKSGRVWHCRIPRADMHGAVHYAYQVDGPIPKRHFEWHAFDPHKVLLDPYAKDVFFPPGMDRLAASRQGSNAGKAPLGILPPCTPAITRLHSPLRHESDAIIYELHVGGFTKHPSSGVSPQARGRFAGIIEKIPYLEELGVTVVELMPVFQFDPSDGNFWGYSPLSFFAPHNDYLQGSPEHDRQNEFRELVDALHNAGMEVVLDVVYNHTCEGDHTGPVYSYKGIDNSTYYLLSDQPAKPYLDVTGAGNTMHCANRAVRKLIMDSIRHWALDMAVDGFRFDLASVFSRATDGSINMAESSPLSDIASDPNLAGVRLIVEPWDASGVSQLGRTFPGISAAQWNSNFRDDVRRFVRGDRGMVPSLMRRLYGSDDLFPDDLPCAYHPYQSINYVTSHDGFTLYDLVSYSKKRNWANGHGNTDGLDDEFSWNCGWEADEEVLPEVMTLRIRQSKNFCCLLLLANGTPMLRAGDEFLQTQSGNSNPYNQDNETSWLDWRRLDRHAGVFRFFKKMIAFRKEHPSLSRSRFWREDVSWYGVGDMPDLGVESHSIAFLLRGKSQGDKDIYVMVNGYWNALDFTIQGIGEFPWRRIVDTSLESPQDIADEVAATILSGSQYKVAGRSIVVLTRSSF